MSDYAPEPLRAIEDFVNTRSIELGTDDVPDPPALAAWMRERGLLPANAGVTPSEHRRALRVREGLRALIARNNDAPQPGEIDETIPDGLDPTALADLADLARDLPLVLEVERPVPYVVPRSESGVEHVLAAYLAAVAWSVADGSWRRLKVCRQPYCRWAYYDHSRNRSRAWCDMTTCGNRAKARTFRQRSR